MFKKTIIRNDDNNNDNDKKKKEKKSLKLDNYLCILKIALLWQENLVISEKGKVISANYETLLSLFSLLISLIKSSSEIVS